MYSCRYGNPSKTQLSELELGVSAEGPGPVEHSWHHAGDHDLCLQLSAKLAGEDISSNDALGSFPLSYKELWQRLLAHDINKGYATTASPLKQMGWSVKCSEQQAMSQIARCV